MKAFLLAAGVGSRLRPITDVTPKCMLVIDDRPLLAIWLNAFDRAGVDEVLDQPSSPAGCGTPPSCCAYRAASGPYGLRTGVARQRRHARRQPAVGRR